MPWHLSVSDPRKVYDSFHNTVCVAQTSDQAALIVKAVNALGPQDQAIKLREPGVPVEKESAEQNQSRATSGTGKPEGAPLDTFEQDNCCGVALSKAGRAGVLAALTSWDCPRCQTQWTPAVTGPIRHWTPAAAVMIFK
jgi:hypothetical protein